jgi:hypothetical protein
MTTLMPTTARPQQRYDHRLRQLVLSKNTIHAKTGPASFPLRFVLVALTGWIKLIAQRHDGTARRGPGRPPVSAESLGSNFADHSDGFAHSRLLAPTECCLVLPSGDRLLDRSLVGRVSRTRTADPNSRRGLFLAMEHSACERRRKSWTTI